ncbi:hypothetical protein D3C71_1737110 [compost metagenome]
MQQMPALIEDIMHNTYIYIHQMADEITCYRIRLRKKCIMNRSYGSGIITPMNLLTLITVDHVYPMNPFILENTVTVFLRTILTYKQFHFNAGLEQHFKLNFHYVH